MTVCFFLKLQSGLANKTAWRSVTVRRKAFLVAFVRSVIVHQQQQTKTTTNDEKQKNKKPNVHIIIHHRPSFPQPTQVNKLCGGGRCVSWKQQKFDSIRFYKRERESSLKSYSCSNQDSYRQIKLCKFCCFSCDSSRSSSWPWRQRLSSSWRVPSFIIVLPSSFYEYRIENNERKRRKHDLSQ